MGGSGNLDQYELGYLIVLKKVNQECLEFRREYSPKNQHDQKI